MIAFNPVTDEDWTSDFEVSINGANQSVTLDSNCLIQLPEWSENIQFYWQGGILFRHEGALVFALHKTASESGALIELLSYQDCRLVKAILTFDSVPLFRGTVSEWTEEQNQLVVKVEIRSPWKTDQLVCRDLALLSEGSLYKRSKWIPVIFGHHKRVEAIPLFDSTSTFTKSSLNLESDEIPLRSQPDWPSTGFVQVNDEIIHYQEYQLSPPVLLGLTRSNPLEHSDRSQVMALPSIPLRWVIADHPATVQALWSSKDEDESLDETIIITEQFSGQLATLATRDQFPLSINHEIFSVPLSIPTVPLDWQIIPPSNAVSPTDAFVDFTTPTRGAEFSAPHPLMIARFVKDLNLGYQRFDLLDQLELRFEVNSNQLWGQTTRFEVEVTDGTNSIIKQLIRDDVFLPEESSEGQKALPSQIINSTGTVPLIRKIHFTSLDQSSRDNWSDWENLFSHSHDLVASCNFNVSNFMQGILTFRV